MKVHNLGNDYAFQRKQKQQENLPESKPLEQPEIPEVKPETYAGDQIQDGGEGETVAASETTETPTKQKSRKKKEAGAENEQPQD